MMSFSDLPDPEKGRKIFEDAYGPQKGPKRFRAVLRVLIPLAIIAVVGGLALGDWRLLRTAYSDVKGWFSPASIAQVPTPPVPPQQPGCTVSGGNNYGHIEQNCR
jgi:hypothetical protein